MYWRKTCSFHLRIAEFNCIKVGGSHVLRNPTIYNILLKMRIVTDLGSGVRRIIKLVKEHTNKEKEVSFVTTENEFIVSIPRC